MNAGRDVYFQFKANICQKPGVPVYLKDIIDVYCPSNIEDRIKNIVVIQSGTNRAITITAIQVIRLIRNNVPDVSVKLVGEGKTLMEPGVSDDKPQKGVFEWTKAILAGLLFFIGSGLAIMYFHADVNMHKVHEMVFTMITGERSENPYILNIPYSIGIGVGIALFFDIFNIGKKRKNPGPLEIELYRYEKDMYSYLRDEEEKEQEQ